MSAIMAMSPLTTTIFYNLPPEYRDRYYDQDGTWYRYCDGYVYEIDPATLVVRNSIELLVT